MEMPIVTVADSGEYVARVVSDAEALALHRKLAAAAQTARVGAFRARIVLDVATAETYAADALAASRKALAVERAHPHLGDDFADHWSLYY